MTHIYERNRDPKQTLQDACRFMFGLAVMSTFWFLLAWIVGLVSDVNFWQAMIGIVLTMLVAIVLSAVAYGGYLFLHDFDLLPNRKKPPI